MQILYVGRLAFPEGMGGSRRFYDIFGKLHELGHDVHFVNLFLNPPSGLREALTRFSWSVERERVQNVTVHQFDREMTTMSVPVLATQYIVRVIRRHDIDAIVLHSPEPYCGIPALFAAKATGRPLIVDYPDPYYTTAADGKLSIFGKFARFVERTLPKQADMVLPISNTLDDSLLQDIIETKRNVVPVGIQYEKIASGDPDPDLVPDGFVVGYMGTYAEREGVPDIISAFDQLRESIDDIRLVVAGGKGGENGDLIERTLRAKPELEPYIIEHDYIDHDRIPDFLASCDVLCAPQHDTRLHRMGFSTKVSECLASGRPVVTTPIGDFGHLLTDREHALLVPPEKPNAIAKAIRELYDDPALGEHIGTHGQRLANRELNAEVQRKRVDEILRTVVNQPG